MLSKLNRWIVKRLTKSEGTDTHYIAVEPSGLRVRAGEKEYVVPWGTVVGVAAYTRAQYIGDTMCLALEIEGGGMLELNERTGGWQQVLADLGTHIPLAMDANEWQTRLVADPSQPIILYRR